MYAEDLRIFPDGTFNSPDAKCTLTGQQKLLGELEASYVVTSVASFAILCPRSSNLEFFPDCPSSGRGLQMLNGIRAPRFAPALYWALRALVELGRIWNVLVRAKFVLRQWANAGCRCWERRRFLSNATAGDAPEYKVWHLFDQAPRERCP